MAKPFTQARGAPAAAARGSGPQALGQSTQAGLAADVASRRRLWGIGYS